MNAERSTCLRTVSGLSSRSSFCSGEFTSPLLCRNQRSPGPPASFHYTSIAARRLQLLYLETGPKIDRMQVREAKDFLVAQTAEQAALEGMPLSDLEKRMMYFTEGKDALEDPTALNDEFEAECNTAAYEAKIARLMHHAYARLREDSDEARRNWDIAIRCLRRGDHYLLVMWNMSPREEWSVGYFLKILAGSLGVIFLMFLVILTTEALEPHWRRIQKHIPTFPKPNPHVLLGLFLGLVAVAFLLRPQIERVGGWLLDNVLLRFIERKGKADDES